MNPIYVPKTPHQHRVEQMLNGIGREVPPGPKLAPASLRVLWARLLLEEVLETIEAAGLALTVDGVDAPAPDANPVKHFLNKFQFQPNNTEDGIDLAGLAKEIADVSVVATGFFSINGISDQQILEIVDENNILKIKTGRKDPETGKWLKAPDHPKPDRDIKKVLKVQSIAAE